MNNYEYKTYVYTFRMKGLPILYIFVWPDVAWIVP